MLNFIHFRFGALNFLTIIFLVITISLQASPFKIDFPEKKELKTHDWISLQAQLQDLHIDRYLTALYPEMKAIHTFFSRCQKGTSQILIDSEKGQLPYQKLVKIGKGGDVCIVCCVPFNRIYPELIESLPEALSPHFNGYFLYQVGGFPNPTGKEIQYSAVPYSFKIFMMLEAYQKGFNKVIWMDSSLLPLRNLQPIIDEFNEKECLLIDGTKRMMQDPKILLPIARETLHEITNFDPVEGSYVCTLLFGLHMNTSKAQKLIELYYQCAEKGTPFLSYYPEEIVLTGIIGSLQSEKWLFSSFKNLIGHGGTKKSNIQEKIHQGYYFYYRDH